LCHFEINDIIIIHGKTVTSTVVTGAMLEAYFAAEKVQTKAIKLVIAITLH